MAHRNCIGHGVMLLIFKKSVDFETSASPTMSEFFIESSVAGKLMSKRESKWRSLWKESRANPGRGIQNIYPFSITRAQSLDLSKCEGGWGSQSTMISGVKQMELSLPQGPCLLVSRGVVGRTVLGAGQMHQSCLLS